MRFLHAQDYAVFMPVKWNLISLPALGVNKLPRTGILIGAHLEALGSPVSPKKFTFYSPIEGSRRELGERGVLGLFPIGQQKALNLNMHTESDRRNGLSAPSSLPAQRGRLGFGKLEWMRARVY